MHCRINLMSLDQLDKTCVRESSDIYSVAMSEGLLDFVEGLLLVLNNEIINADYRACVVDINLEEYFNKEFSRWDDIKHVMLNQSKRSHHEKF